MIRHVRHEIDDEETELSYESLVRLFENAFIPLMTEVDALYPTPPNPTPNASHHLPFVGHLRSEMSRLVSRSFFDDEQHRLQRCFLDWSQVDANTNALATIKKMRSKRDGNQSNLSVVFRILDPQLKVSVDSQN